MAEDSAVKTTNKLRAQVNSVRDNFEVSEDWVTTRRLKRPDGQRWSDVNEGYLDVLPRFHGEDFLFHLGEVIKRKGRASILDVGTGAGAALIDLRKMFPDPNKLRIVGIGSQKDIQGWARDIPRNLLMIEPKRELKEANIEFVHTNFPDAHKVLPTGSFDIITGVYSFDWINYPSYSLIKKAWRLLSDGGVAFIGPFEFRMLDNQKRPRNGSEYLRNEYGLDFNEHPKGISFRKTQFSLPDIFSSKLGNEELARPQYRNSHI